jgi:hypothetical protein
MKYETNFQFLICVKSAVSKLIPYRTELLDKSKLKIDPVYKFQFSQYQVQYKQFF